MGATGKLFKEIGYLIPDVDRRRVDRLARLLDGTEGMAIQGAAGSTGIIYVPGSPTGNPRYFKLAGETNAANSWGGAGYFQYSDNGVTLVTQIDDAGYIFNSAGTDIDFTVKSDDNATMFLIDGNLNVASFGGAVDSSYRLKIYGSAAIDKTYTAATAGEHIVKITATDSVTQTAGMLQTLLVDHNITGAKSGTAHSEGISVDMNIGSNINNAYASAVYISQSGNPNSSLIEGMNIYLEDMGSGTLSNILGLDIGINSTNVASARHAGMRIRNHSGTATDAILIESTFGTVLNMAGATSTQDIKLSDGSIINDTNGFWGIGTGTPGQEVEIYADGPALRLRDSGATADATASFIEFGGTDAGNWVRTGYVGDAISANTDIYLKAEVGGLQLGDSTASKIVYINGGTVNAYGAVMIDGAADAVQLTVQANATQSPTVNIVTIEKSDGTDLAGFDERGVLFSDGGIDADSVFIGNNAGNINHTNAIGNVGIGDDVLKAVTTGDYNVFIGWGSGEDCTIGKWNTCVGAQAGLNITEGFSNIAIGYKALDVVTTGDLNVAIGTNALGANTADENVAVGSNALVGNTLGTQNMAVGTNAARDNTEGIGNMAIGTNALLLNATGDYNTAIGTGSLAATTGDRNTAIGALAGSVLTSGANCVFVGMYAGNRQTTLSNLLIIDNQQRADIATELTNCILYGVMAAAPANQTLRINAGATVAGTATIGDGGTTNYLGVSATGDVNFVGSAGMAYGSMYTNADIAVTATSATWVELDAGTAWTTGKVHNCTFTDPEITVTNAGTYFITYDMTLTSSIANKHVETGIMIDSTVTDGPAHGAAGVQNEGRSHVELLAIEKGVMGKAIIQLAAGKTISLAVRNVDSGDPTVTCAHGNLVVIQIAGASA